MSESDKPFKKEHRYIVLKVKDVDQLNRIERKALEQICESVDDIRASRGKLSFECVVIESDWPEYETVWKMIQDRVEGKFSDKELKSLQYLLESDSYAASFQSLGQYRKALIKILKGEQ